MTKTEKAIFVVCGALAVLFIVLVFLVPGIFPKVLFFVLAAAMIFLLVLILDWLCKSRQICLGARLRGGPDSRGEEAGETAAPGEPACDVDGEEVPCELPREAEEGEAGEENEAAEEDGEAGTDGAGQAPDAEKGAEEPEALEEEKAPPPEEAARVPHAEEGLKDVPADEAEQGPKVGEAPYIGHAVNLKFHLPDCPTLPSESNRVPLASREEALARGFTPCTNCRP